MTTTLPTGLIRSSNDLLLKLRDDIANTRFGDDGYLGTETDMARETGLSRMRVRRAIDRLEFEGTVERRVAKGVFVCQQALLHGIVQIIVPSLEQCMPRRIIRGARKVAQRTETYILVFDADFAVEHELKRLRQLPESGARGAIIVSPHEMTLQTILTSFDAIGFPYVLVDDEAGHLSAPAVLSDNFEGGRLLGQTLAARGYRRAALLLDGGIHTARMRRDGFLSAWSTAGLSYDPRLQEPLRRPADWRPSGFGEGEHWGLAAARRRVVEFMRSAEPPDALVCENDFMAWDVVKTLRAGGWSVPGDVGVVGFDNTPDLEQMSPRLTTIAQDMDGMGGAAMELLVERVRTGRRPADLTLPVALVEGETLRPATPS